MFFAHKPAQASIRLCQRGVDIDWNIFSGYGEHVVLTTCVHMYVHVFTSPSNERGCVEGGRRPLRWQWCVRNEVNYPSTDRSSNYPSVERNGTVRYIRKTNSSIYTVPGSMCRISPAHLTAKWMHVSTYVHKLARPHVPHILKIFQSLSLPRWQSLMLSWVDVWAKSVCASRIPYRHYWRSSHTRTPGILYSGIPGGTPVRNSRCRTGQPFGSGASSLGVPDVRGYVIATTTYAATYTAYYSAYCEGVTDGEPHDHAQEGQSSSNDGYDII